MHTLTKQQLNKLNRLISFSILCFILFLNYTTLFSQGTLRGIITDKTDKTPLIAVNIIIKGTTMGTVTDFNGEYMVPLKAGTYTLQFSYFGYKTVEDTITIENKQLLELNKGLVPATDKGTKVLIAPQAKGQLSAINQQLLSNQIVNVYSTEYIRNLPNENTAQAISHLPGISLDGTKVVIRGIESKMNKIMINGIEMPGTEANTRATDLSIISASMLSGMEVYKTLTPDMDAEAIGGIVNLRLREAPKGFHFNITSQGTYNQQEKIYGGTKLWGDISNRFLNNRLGAILNINYETKCGGDDWINIGYNEYGSSYLGEGTYMLSSLSVFDQLRESKTIGGYLVLDYNLPNGQILFTSIRNIVTPEETLYSELFDISSNSHYALLNRNKYSSLFLNNSLRIEQQLSIIKLDAGISSNSIDRKFDFGYENSFKNSSLQNPFIIDFITMSRKPDMEPYDIYNALDTASGNTARYYKTTISPVNYNEKQWMADINLQIPLQISDNIEINLKFGGKYLKKERNYDEDFLMDFYQEVKDNILRIELSEWFYHEGIENNGILYLSDVRDYDYTPNEGFMNNQSYRFDWVIDKEFMDEMWLNQVNLDPDSTNLVSDSRASRNDYWGKDSKTATYAMAEIKIGQKLTIIPGVRSVKIHNEYSAPKVSQSTLMNWALQDTLTKPTDYNYLLPHFHLRINATEWLNIHFSYNKTLSKPNYNHAIPFIYYHEIDMTAKAGNPDIKPAVSKNIDVNFSFYFYKLGMFTIGWYLKEINDISYMQPTLMNNITDTSIINEFPIEAYPSLLSNSIEYYMNSPYTANIKGIEMEWQSNLSWLPAPFNGIVLNTNYTHVYSETKYMQDLIEYVVGPGSLFPEPVETDTYYINRLLYQSNDIANISLGYDFKGLSARLSYQFQGNVLSAISSRPELNEYTDKICRYDFIIKQNIPLKFGEFEVFASAINFTNVPKKLYSTFKRNNKASITDNITYERYSGSKFQLGLRFKF